MKIKSDFVTNSSSCAYIVSLRESEIPEFEDFINIMDKNPEYSNEGVRIWKRFDTMKKLYEYATGQPYDWVSKAMTPILKNMCAETYHMCKEAIKDGCVAFYVAVDYNACDEFEQSQYKKMMELCPL